MAVLLNSIAKLFSTGNKTSKSTAMRIYFLTSKDWLFFCCTVFLVLVAANIPLTPLFQVGILTAYAHELASVFYALVIISLSQLAGRRLGFNAMRRVPVRPVYKNWLLLLPFFFPGLMLGLHFTLQCYTGVQDYLIMIPCTILLAISEEAVFRGLILGYLFKMHPLVSPHKLCITSAILFSLIHLNNIPHAALPDLLNQLIYAFYMGLLFSALMIRVGNIWLLGIAHGILNFISSPCSRFENISTNQSIQDSFSTPLVQLLSTALVFSPTLLLVWFLLLGIKRPARMK